MTQPTIKEKTSYCDSVPCTIHDHSDWLDRVKNYHHSQPSVSALEQFNEEVISEFCKIYTPVYLDLEASIAENLDVNLRNLITQKLTEHKELILKMVREKVPMIERGEGRYCQECEDFIDAGNSCMCLEFNRRNQEFLNNLNTI